MSFQSLVATISQPAVISCGPLWPPVSVAYILLSHIPSTPASLLQRTIPSMSIPKCLQGNVMTVGKMNKCFTNKLSKINPNRSYIIK